jgi:predicted HTH transcriptional regulator
VFDTKQEILDRLQAGEDSLVEFKEVRLGERSVISPNTEDMAGECVAFANADGGVIFLGVDDDGVVQGIPKDRMGILEQWVINVATNNCEPPIRPVLRKEVLFRPDGTEGLVLLVEVRRGLYVHRTSGGRYYIRVGSTKRDLTPAELARLMQQRGRTFVFDEQPVVTATSEDLDMAALERFFGKKPAIPWPDLLRNTRVITSDEEGIERPTVAGLLAFGRKPREHLPSAYIDAAVYRAERLTSEDLIHAQSFESRVDEQIDEATAFIERFMLKPARKPTGREDFPQYAIGAVHEAIVNAVAHRDYSLSGAKIRLFLFSNRFELYSPGGLPNTLTLENMPYRVFTRNQLLVNFLSRMRSQHTGRAFLESRGEGVRRILEESERHAGRRPEYCLLGEELLLTIWAKRSPHEGTA